MPSAIHELMPARVTQPHGGSIYLDTPYGAASQFRAVSKALGSSVPRHLVAIAAHNANSLGIPDEELADIVTDMHAADTILRTEPSVPLIYHLHSEDAFAVTPEKGGTGFRLIDTSTRKHGYSRMEVAVNATRVFRLHSSIGFEEEYTIAEETPITMFRPLSFLTSGEPKEVERFLNNQPEWKKYPNSEVVVGRSAVDAFLKAQAKKDLLTESLEIDARAVTTSWAMLASAGLQRIGYASSIGKRGDLVHRASIEGLAEVIAGSLGYNTHVARGYSAYEKMFVRRIGGVEFDLRADAQEIGAKAAAKLFSDEGLATSFNGLLYGNKEHIETYASEVAGRFIEYAASVK